MFCNVVPQTQQGLGLPHNTGRMWSSRTVNQHTLRYSATPVCSPKSLECRNWWLNWTLRNHDICDFDRNVAYLLLTRVRI